MSSPFKISIHIDEHTHQTIRKNGFITCIVMFKTPPFKSLRMAFCLHCRELRSYTGCLKHTKLLVAKQRIDLSRLFCPEKVEEYKQQIIADVELVCEKWTSKTSLSQMVVPLFENSDPCEQQDFCEPSLNPQQSQDLSESCTTGPSQQDNDSSAEIPEQDPLFELEWDCFEDCLLSRWSCFSVLNSENRFEEAQTVL